MRGKNFTEAERDAIRAMLAHKFSIRKIATILNRGKSGVQTQIKRMKKDGSIYQGVLDLGQFDEQE